VTDEAPEIDIDTLVTHLETGAMVVDVREDDEYRDGHVPGAVHIPLATVPDALDRLPTDEPVYVVCAVGGRSAQAVSFLRTNGIEATNVAGGTKAWIEAGKPVVVGSDPL